MGGISPTNAVSKSELASGSKRDIIPIRVLNNVVYLSNLDNSPRVLTPVLTTPNQFQTQDLALYSQHLFGVHESFIEEASIASSFNPSHRSGAEITSWTYAGRPSRLIWAVRADGVLLSCTYAPEHDVAAWCKHSTKGRFRAVQSVHEKNSDTVYMVVERGGHKFIEYFSKEDTSYLEHSVPVDAAVRTQNKEPTVATKLEIHQYVNGNRQGAEDDDSSVDVAGWGNRTGLGATITGSGYVFTNDDIGDYIRTAGGLYRITNIRSTTQAPVTAVREVPFTDSSYFVHGTEYRHPIYQWEIVDSRTIYNGFHLQDQDIMTIERDGSEVVGVRENRSVGSNGQLATSASAARGLIAGLPFESRIKFLPITNAQFPTENKVKSINGISLRTLDSSSMEAGAGGELYPVIFDENGVPKTLFSTGIFNVDVGGDWELDEVLYIQSKLPYNILGVVISYDLGDQIDGKHRLRGEFAI